MREKINSLFSSKVFQFVILVAVVTAIPLTVMIAGEQQELRQRASETPESVIKYFITPTVIDLTPPPVSDNNISFSNLFPVDFGILENPVTFNATIYDTHTSVSSRKVDLVVDNKVEKTFTYNKANLGSNNSVTFSFIINPNLSNKQHSWFVRVTIASLSKTFSSSVISFFVNSKTN